VRYLLAVFRALFWVAIALLPLLMIKSSLASMTDGGCWPGSACFQWSEPLIKQVDLMGLVARVLLWPLALWNLGGRWLWRRLRRRSGNGTHERYTQGERARDA
jgi:hypothetical protein